MPVSLIGSNLGLPSYVTESLASSRFTAVVWGISASSTASSASVVPATKARIWPLVEPGGILLKSWGRFSDGT